MREPSPPFRISFLEGHNKPPIEDVQHEFSSFKDFVSANSKRLSYADLRWQDLKGCDLTGGDLSGANLSYAKLDSAIINKACLDNANFRGASLTNIKSSSVSASNIRAEYADFSNSKIEQWSAEKAALTGVTLDGTNISTSNFCGTDWSGAHGVAPLVSNTDLRASSFREAFIASPTFRSCHFSHNSARSAIEWLDARMPGASIEGCKGSLPITITLESRISRLSAAAASASILGLGASIFAAAAAVPTLSGLAGHLYGTAAVITATGGASVVALRSNDSIWNRAARAFGGILGKAGRKIVSATNALSVKLGLSDNAHSKALKKFQQTLSETYICLGSKQSEEILKEAFHALYIGRDGDIANDMISTFGPSSELLICNRSDFSKLESLFSRMSIGHEAGCSVIVDPHAVVSANGQTPALISTGKVLTDVCYIEKRPDGKSACIVAEYKKDGCLFGMTLTSEGITTRFRPEDPETVALKLPSLKDAILSMERSGQTANIAEKHNPCASYNDATLTDRVEYEHPSGLASPA